MRQRVKHSLTVLLGGFFLLPAGMASAADMESAAVNVSAPFLYTLSNFTGILPVSWAPVSIDESRDEVYVLPGQGIKVFNDKGM